MSSDFISTKTAAIQAEVHSGAIFSAIKRGRIRVVRKKGRVFLERLSFEAWLKRLQARREAKDWLRELLSNGPMPEQQIRSRAKQDGFSWATVRRAKKDLCAKSQKASFGGGWIWELPDK
jgi:hypothetical protein